MASRTNKRAKPPDSTPPKQQDKRAKEGPDDDEDALCITCKNVVEEESIECEMCFKWEHRVCANISSEEFNLLTNGSSNIMFFCTQCRPKVTIALKFFNDIQTKQSQFETRLQSLENNLNKLTVNLNSQSDEIQTNPNSIQSMDMATSSSNTTLSKSTIASSNSDKKLNVVVYGVAEHPPKTNRQTRLDKDLDSLLSCFSDIDSKFDSSAIKDYFRLGKYDSSSSRPRPLLVKLLRRADVNTLLQNRSKLTSSLSLKPDLTPEERAIEALLMKERWSLIQKGTDRKQIKIRNHSLFLNNKLHCKLVDSKIEFQSQTSSSENHDNSSQQSSDHSQDSHKTA